MRKYINILLGKLEAEGFTYDFNEHSVVSADVACNYLIDLDDDFKSRVCMNCKHYVKPSCPIDGIFISQDSLDEEPFGCNRFEKG